MSTRRGRLRSGQALALALAAAVSFVPLEDLGHHHEPLAAASTHVEPMPHEPDRPVSDVCLACMVHQAPSSATGAVVVSIAPPATPGSVESRHDPAPSGAPWAPESARAPPVLLAGTV